MRASQSHCLNYVETQRDAIDDCIKAIKKNFSEMDFENAYERDTMEEITNQMVRVCTQAKSSLSDYTFS
ncbi:hypothetical protein CKN61_01485 [Carnobacterium divergens]|uniref:hypothetical protein n=1 Tax=Carnobacterium divergens TaxID=2748 RepID=UPI0010739603|nr:hypothetical protein [Carnobacterium divergens]TFI93916.1 hypothetical protein CKN61_01485 [Carnobacterium divergens]